MNEYWRACKQSPPWADGSGWDLSVLEGVWVRPEAAGRTHLLKCARLQHAEPVQGWAVPLVTPVPVTSAPPMVYRGTAGTDQVQAKYLLKK